MAHQVTLSDGDYAALKAVSARTGSSVEQLVHQALADSLPASQPPKQIGSYTYPTGEPLTDAEWAEEEALAQEIGSERPWASEIVIDDRGPR